MISKNYWCNLPLTNLITMQKVFLFDVFFSNLVSYQLYNQATGLLVAEGKMERSGGTLDFNQVNSGIYILRIQVSDAIFEVHRVAFK